MATVAASAIRRSSAPSDHVRTRRCCRDRGVDDVGGGSAVRVYGTWPVDFETKPAKEHRVVTATHRWLYCRTVWKLYRLSCLAEFEKLHRNSIYYLNSSFGEIDFDGQFFTEKDVRVVGFVEGVFQFFQLEIGESRPVIITAGIDILYDVII